LFAESAIAIISEDVLESGLWEIALEGSIGSEDSMTEFLRGLGLVEMSG